MTDEPGEAAKPLPWRAVGLCVLLSVLWGGTPTSIRVAGDAVPPIFGAFCRFALASLFMLPFCRARRAPLLPGRGQWGRCGVLGAFLTVQIALYHVGVSETNASHAALFINTFVFWVAVTEHFVTGDDRLTPARWAGLGLAFHAKPAVAAASHSAITCTDLRTALYFQGYSDEEIAADD